MRREDIAVPFDVFTTLSKLITGGEEGSTKAMVQLRTSIKVLLNYNLLKGSTAEGSGVFMHDIVRDYTIAQLDGDGLRELQLQVTQALLDARPEGRFPTADPATPWTPAGYVARQASWHMRGGLGEGEAPLQAVAAFWTRLRTEGWDALCGARVLGPVGSVFPRFGEVLSEHGGEVTLTGSAFPRLGASRGLVFVRFGLYPPRATARDASRSGTDTKPTSVRSTVLSAPKASVNGCDAAKAEVVATVPDITSYS